MFLLLDSAIQVLYYEMYKTTHFLHVSFSWERDAGHSSTLQNSFTISFTGVTSAGDSILYSDAAIHYITHL
jgi:hypothetical protein